MTHHAPENNQPFSRKLSDVPPTSLAQWQAAWHEAADRRPDNVSECFYEFAGKSVCLRIVGAQLAQHVQRTFSHLARGAARTPALRIDLWDEEATGVSRPRGMPRDPFDVRAQIGSGVATIRAGGQLFGYERSTSVTWFDRAAGCMVGWRASGERLPIEERSKPIPLVLRIWYYDQNVDIIHAGLVAKNGRGVLIGGRTGTGKSTTALTCLAGGFDYLGDDEVGLALREDATYLGHSLYSSARPLPGPGGQLPLLFNSARAAHIPQAEKPLVFITDIAAQSIRPSAQVCAVALPRVADMQESQLRPVSQGEALLRLGATSLFTPLGLGDRAFNRLKNVVASVPTYSLELGRDASCILRCVERILAGASA